jgi:serine/threonine protein kinase
MTEPALIGTVLDGKFQIDRALASGAAGDVYEATHLGLAARVAVKVLRAGIPETADIRRRRFQREARVAAQIQSDHVVRVFDIVVPEEGAPEDALTYIVMELLQGETLAERLRRAGPVAPRDAVDWILQATRPLAEMHDAGIVHRDVKPSNLFLARDADGKERIKLLDFGVAAFQQPLAEARGVSSLTLTEAMIGTPRYMAPEQVRSARCVDARADVWALGVTLFELLAGSPPFDGQTVLAVLNQIEVQEPRSLLERSPGTPAALATVVHRCLAKDPALRPADARALGALLREAMDASRLERESESAARGDDATVASTRETALGPVTRRSRRAIVALAAVALTLALIGLVALRGRAPSATATDTPEHATAGSPPDVQSATVSSGKVGSPDARTESAVLTPTATPTQAATARAPADPPRVTAAPSPRRPPTRPAPRSAATRTPRAQAEDDDRIE